MQQLPTSELQIKSLKCGQGKQRNVKTDQQKQPQPCNLPSDCMPSCQEPRKQTHCPKCGSNINDSVECQSCGIIFEKYLQRKKKLQQDEAPSATPSSPEKTRVFTHCPKCGNKKSDSVQCRICQVIYEEYFELLRQIKVSQKKETSSQPDTKKTNIRQRWLAVSLLLTIVAATPWFYLHKNHYRYFFLTLFNQNNYHSSHTARQQTAYSNPCKEFEKTDPGKVLQCYLEETSRYPDYLYGWSCIGYLSRQLGKLNDAENAFRVILKQGIGTNNQVIINYAYYGLGLIHLDRSEPDQAIMMFQNYLDIAHSLGSSKNDIGGAYINLGSAYSQKGDQEKAAEMFQKTLSILKGSNDFDGKQSIAIATGNLANYFKPDQLDKAMEMYNKSLEMAQSIDDKSTIAHVYRNMGWRYYKQKKFAISIEMFRKSLDLYQTLQEKVEIAESYYALGCAYEKCKELNIARSMLDKALVLYYEIGTQSDIEETQRVLNKVVTASYYDI